MEVGYEPIKPKETEQVLPRGIANCVSLTTTLHGKRTAVRNNGFSFIGVNLSKPRVFALSAGIALLVFFWVVKDRSTAQFQQDAWKAWVETEDAMSLRWDMVYDLRDTHDLVAMTKTEINDLLGERYTDTPDEYSYYLGMARKGVNTGRLMLTFGDGNAVINVRVWDG